MSDAEQFMPAGTAAVSQEATAGAADSSKADKLPALTIDMSNVQARSDFMVAEMEKHLATGMHGYYGDLKNTWAYKSMKAQLDGYSTELVALPKAELAYNSFVAPANQAVDMYHRMEGIGERVGIDAEMDVSKLLTPQQQTALKNAYQAQPALLSALPSVENKRANFEAKRTALLGHAQSMQKVLIGDAVAQLNAKIKDSQDKKKEIEDKIKRVQEIAGYIQKGASIVAAGAGGVAAMGGAGSISTFTVFDSAGTTLQGTLETTSFADPTMGTIKSGAGHVGTGAGYLGTAAGIAMELYYAQDLQNLQAKIDSAAAMKDSLEGVSAAAQLDGIKLQFQAAKMEFELAANEYKDAVRDRQIAYAKIAADADKSREGKAANGGKEDISEIMLYISSVRETFQTMRSGKSAGDTAKSAIDDAFKATAHRSQGYQTNYEAHGTTQRVESTGGSDYRTLSKMSQSTSGWLAKYEVSIKTLEKQEQQAQRLMGGIGASKF